MPSRTSARSLNETRLRIPSRSDRFVHRPRITGLLDRAVALPVTIVTGPAGTGKTLAVADWTTHGRLPGPPVWVSLDRGDNDPARFWSSVVSAIVLAAGPGAVAGLDIPDAPDADFLNGVARNLDGSFVLILDDAHELHDGQVLEWLDTIVRWPPEGVRIVLVSRHDPPLALHRLRLEGRLAEVRFADLALTGEESRELLSQWGVNLSPAAFERLLATTEGWVAAIRLAALALQSADDPSASIEHFGGPAFVSGYLWDELLRQLPDAYPEFLLRTSVADRICASLAAALTGEGRADEMLRALAKEQLLIQEYEGTAWYRTHSLLTEVLRGRLRADRPDLERQLHQTAALWFEREGVWLESLRHAVASGDWEFAGRVAARSGAVLGFGAERSAFGNLLRDLPSGVAIDHPELAAAAALAAHFRGEPLGTSALVALAEPAVASLPEPRRSIAQLVLEVTRAGHAQREGNAPDMVAATSAAAALLAGLSTQDAPGWSRFRGAIVAMRGAAELWAGHPDSACDLLREAVTAYPAGHIVPFGAAYYGGLLALAQIESGDMAAGRVTALAAVEGARAQGRARGYEVQWAWLALAMVEVQAGDEEAAQAAVAACEESAARRANPFVITLLRIVAARRLLSAGDLAAARRTLAEVDARLAQHRGMRAFVGITTAVRIDFEIAAGNADAALMVLAAYDESAARGEFGVPPPSSDRVDTARARLMLSTGRADRVHPAVAHLLAGTGVESAKAWLAVALAEDRLRHDSLSVQALTRSLDLAAQQGLALCFLRPGPALAAALRRHQDVVGTHRDIVDIALASGANGVPKPHQAPVERLTERENAVLAYLATMSSNAEIAAALSISENTVKQHLKAIYRKLGVGKRREAVRAARDHGLL